MPNTPINITFHFTICFLSTAFGHIAFSDEFPSPVNTEKSTQQPMTPEEVIRTATLPTGFQLTTFAAEPDVQNPIAITTDRRGRLWVAENYTWAGNSLGNYRTDLRDRLIILEDTTGDGKHDKRTVFYDQLTKLTSVEVGFGGVWVLALPNLLFIPDQDGDDIPDGPPVIILDGFNEDSVSHTPANGLKWGPDGWLYARHGILATSLIGQPGATQSQRVAMNTGVWRYHPAHGTTEAVMHGMTNSWGFDYNKTGDLFCINTVIGHLWHVIPGARTERMFGADMNPHAYQLLPQVADHVHWDTGELWHQVRSGVSDTTLAAGGGHAHIGLMIYQGDNWPQSYRDKVYTLNLHGKRINCDRLERQGAGYVAKHEPDLAVFADPFFRGMDLITGADGGVFIADWSDTGECHDHDGVHRTSGRIYKLTFGTPNIAINIDLSKKSNAELVNLQSHPNAWYGRQARQILHERFLANKDSLLIETKNQKPAQTSQVLHVHWAQHVAGNVTPETLLESADESIRTWGVRLLSDSYSDQQPLTPIHRIALQNEIAKDTSGIISLYVAGALQRFSHVDRLILAQLLIERSDLANDRFFPIMVWLGIEAAVPTDMAQSLKLCASSEIPLVTRNLARRITEAIQSDMHAVENLISIAQQQSMTTANVPNAQHIILGMSEALAGWSRSLKPKNWTSQWDSLMETDNSDLDADLKQAINQLNVIFGDGRALDELKAIAVDPKASPATRGQAIRAIASGKIEGFDKVLLDLLSDRTIQIEVLTGLEFYNNTNTPAKALSQVHTYSPEGRRQLIRLLVSRADYARNLLEAVTEGKIRYDEISAFHARQIHDFKDIALSAQLRQVWGDVRPTADDKRAAIDSLRKVLTTEAVDKADTVQGRKVFNKVCSNCHVLYGQGQKIGPDLTGSNRHNLEYLLENIIDPSASVANDFRTTVFILDDGRVLSGVINGQSDRTISVQTPDGLSVIDRELVVDSKPSGLSLMPEALLQNLGASDIKNLFAYLMTRSQVSLISPDDSPPE